MKTPNGQCTKRCRWLKVTKTQKNLGKNKKTQGKTIFRESWLGPPLPKSLEILCFFCFFCFSKVFTKCGVLQGNWHESQAKLSKCLWECCEASQNIILNHGKTALPGAAVLLYIYIYNMIYLIDIYIYI